MKILTVTVCREWVEVLYERKSGFMRKKYNVVPDKVLDFMMTHKHKTRHNGDYVYSNEEYWNQFKNPKSKPPSYWQDGDILKYLQ